MKTADLAGVWCCPDRFTSSESERPRGLSVQGLVWTCRPDVHSGGESDLTTVGWMMRFVALCNFTGHPAMSIPVGHTSKGQPTADEDSAVMC